MSRKHKRAQKQKIERVSAARNLISESRISFSSNDYGLLFGALLLYVATRLTGISTFPIHYDEGSYLHWGFLISRDWNQRFIMSGWGGKQPLFIWLISLFNLFVPDTILSGRLLVLMAGIGTMIAMWLIAQRIFGRATAWLGVFLYIVIPYTALFDRVAVIDGFLTLLALWTLYLSLRLHENPLLALPVTLLVAAALLTKSSSVIYLPLLCLGALASPDFRLAYRRIFPWLALAFIAGYAVYFFLFGSTDAAKLVSQLEQQVRFNLSAEELLGLPLTQWMTNLTDVTGYFWGLFTPPLALLLIPSIIWAVARERRDILVLVAWGLFPFIVFVLIARGMYSRYLILTVPPLLILLAAFVNWLAQYLRERVRKEIPPALAASLLILLSLYPFSQTLMLGVDPSSVSLPASSRLEEYIDNGTFGLWSARVYILEQARANGSCFVLSHWLFGNVRDATYAVFSRDRQIKTLSIVPIQTGRITPQGSTFAVIDPYADANAVYAPRTLSQNCVYYVLDTDKVDKEVAYRSDLSLVMQYPNLKGRGAIGVYAIRFDERFLNP